MRNFEIIILLNKLSYDIRDVKRELIYTFINQGYVIDKKSKE